MTDTRRAQETPAAARDVDFGWWALPSGLQARITWEGDTGLVYVLHPIAGRVVEAAAEGPDDVRQLLAGLDPADPAAIGEAKARLRAHAGDGAQRRRSQAARDLADAARAVDWEPVVDAYWALIRALRADPCGLDVDGDAANMAALEAFVRAAGEA